MRRGCGSVQQRLVRWLGFQWSGGLAAPSDVDLGEVADYLKMRTAVEAFPLPCGAQLAALLHNRSGSVRDHPAPPVATAGAYRTLDELASEAATGSEAALDSLGAALG